MHRTLLRLALFGSPALAASTVKQLFNFTTYVDIENSHLRPDGNLLLSTFANGSLYQLDPASSNPQAELVAVMPGATALTGIAAIGTDKYAVIGGVRGSFEYDNETVYTVEFTRGSANVTVGIAATLPDAVMLNGVDSLPSFPNVILAADSRVASIWRVDADTGAVANILTSDAFNATENATVPIGINGLKIFNGSVYFTNTARATFGRVAITDDGYPDGDGEVEIIATLNDTASDWDDFVIDKATGVAYIAQANSAVASIAPDGTQTIVLGGDNSNVIIGPTSVTLALDNTTAYVTTRGGSVNNSTFQFSGQVVEFTL
ncbi:hypothetical protein PENSPDRAFT_592171 [Peniophora sp. CONT]|nr:hypothetical protein PENSPDRAFT_592171 [Peniophora sp. CONT]